ncbi:hypothetical protein BD626DRAFT_569280 [Schizophyllum amplum]|uniref:Extracellular membrane protein CFEM domain-containing protein n=1 Tax=Schizophyllum amplum TaxID=97359 RepID=A0A550CEM3_9AGAR|nr:hypothetical protein BD626DRAFT_569280 [Auriculariopsis ampla]
MQSFTFSAFAMMLMLAGQVHCDCWHGQLHGAELLDLSSSLAVDACKTMCDPTRQAIQACGDDATCLCRADTVASLLQCEQCMLTSLIVANVRMPDPRVGSQVVLSGYAAACNASDPALMPNATQTALAIPTADIDGTPFDWPGPSGIFLPTPALVLAVTAAAGMGGGFIYLLSNL